MKYKKIMLFSAIVLPINIILRTLGMLFTVELTTGFFKNEYELLGKLILFLIFFFSVLSAVFAYTSHRLPEQPPKPNRYIAAVSFLMALSTLFLVLFEKQPEVIKPWLLISLKASGIVFAVLFVMFGLQAFIKIDINKLFYIVPTVYLIFRLICDFTAVSALAMISDNLLLLAAYGSALWFMLRFAKLYNNIENESNFRGLLASAIASVMFCFTQSIPHLVINIFTANSYLHTTFAENLHIFFIGCFILVFSLFYFSRKNSCK